jgi:hypothetical protein
MPKVTDTFEVEITALTTSEKNEIYSVWESFGDHCGWSDDDYQSAAVVFHKLIKAKKVYFASE